MRGNIARIGRWLMRHGRLTEAERHFAAAIDLAPDDFWAYFQQMRCNFELAQFDEALTSAKICVALAPPTHRAECFYNRACALKHCNTMPMPWPTLARR